MKDCPPGKYFCNKEKKCMPIPKGWHVMPTGYLMRDDEHGNGNGKKSKGGKKNGNGHSGTNGSSSGNGNGNGNGAAGGGMSEDKKWIQKATKNMRKDKPCTGEKFGSETCPPGSKRYNLAKTFRKMAKNEDWKPEIEHSKLGDAVKKKAEKKRKEAESSLPPHLKLDAMKKAFAHTNEEVVTEADPRLAIYQSGMTDASRVKGPVGKTVDKVKDKVKRVLGKKDKVSSHLDRYRFQSGMDNYLKSKVKKEEVELDEGGMARQVKHSKSRSTAVLTANRGDKSSKENKARNKELGKKIRSMGYGYKKVKGEYPEKDEKTGKEKTVSEPSMAVNAPKKKFKKFKKQMKRLGKEYNQDAVITKKGKDKATLHPTHKRARKTSTGVSRKGSKLGQVRPGRTGKYGHTKVGSKTYTYEATTLPRVNGQTMYVTFQWRGKYMSLQMFFPELKVPSKKEVQDAVVKVYPGSRVMNYDVVLRDPTKPILQLPEDVGVKSSKCPTVDEVQSKQIAQKKTNMTDKKKEVLQKIQAIRTNNIK